jgi:hypothetical protein
MTEIIVMMASNVIAILWVIYQELQLRKLRKSNQILHMILSDVATGEANVYYENGVLKAKRKADRAAPLH